jgi:hypothetical protein
VAQLATVSDLAVAQVRMLPGTLMQLLLSMLVMTKAPAALKSAAIDLGRGCQPFPAFVNTWPHHLPLTRGTDLQQLSQYLLTWACATLLDRRTGWHCVGT